MNGKISLSVHPPPTSFHKVIAIEILNAKGTVSLHLYAGFQINCTTCHHLLYIISMKIFINKIVVANIFLCSNGLSVSRYQIKI